MIRAHSSEELIYNRFTGFLPIETLVHEEVREAPEYPESFRQNECIVLKILTTIKSDSANSFWEIVSFFKIQYIKKNVFVLSEAFRIFWCLSDLFMDKISSRNSLIQFCR
jgi:hypothetical protein